MLDDRKYHAALYLRLSKDDNRITESMSIQTQRKMLLSYAEENGFFVEEIYVDDGFSGTNFERPAFQKLLLDIECGKINMVIVKDLSRLGRDYIQTGQYTELYFPEKKVRFIAVNDGYDSVSSYDDMTPFKNMINEMYARDISKKIRSALRTKMKDGAYIGNFAPYGYQKDPYNKNHLVIDEEASKIVKAIFDMAAEGKKNAEIAEILNEKGVLVPLEYRRLRTQKKKISVEKRIEWSAGGVRKILNNQIYLGNLIQGKTAKYSFKNKKTITTAKENWIVVPNTHEAIIEKKLFEQVSKRKIYVKNKEKYISPNILCDLVWCSDCGKKMTVAKRNKDGEILNFVCSSYKLYGKSCCTNHFVDYQTLCEIVMKCLKEELPLEEKEINKLILEEKKNMISFPEQRKQILKQRLEELEKLLALTYEDYCFKRITPENYQSFSKIYESQKNDIKKELTQKIEKKIVETEEMKIKENIYKLLNCFIDKIEIGQGQWIFENGQKKKNQNIQIFYRFFMEKGSQEQKNPQAHG